MDNLRAQAEYLHETKALMHSKLTSYGAVDYRTPFRGYVEGIDKAVGNTVSKLIGVSYSTIEAQDLKGVTTLRKYALYRNSYITEATKPENVKSLGDYAFGTCLALAKVTIPAGVSLGAGCFSGCTALQSVYLPEVTSASQIPTMTQTSAFSNTTCSFVVRAAPDKKALNQELYTADSNWNTYADRFIFEEVTT